MGKNYQGVHGNWTGKVGNVVGAMKDGRTILRIYQPIVANPNTAGQQLQRSKLSLVAEYLRNLANIVKLGFTPNMKYGTRWSDCIRENMRNAISVVGGAASLDYTKVSISNGNLDLPVSPSASNDANDVTIQWTDNSGVGNALASDKLIYAIRNKDKNVWMSGDSTTARSARSFTIAMPSAWTSDTIYIYGFFVRADGSMSSDTMYLGEIIL